MSRRADMLAVGFSDDDIDYMMECRIEELEKLMAYCRAFIKKQGISCSETIYQCDWVSENALQFIEGVCDIVGYEREEEEDDE